MTDCTDSAAPAGEAAVAETGPPSVDFQVLFDQTPTPLMLLDRQLRYVAANHAYLQVTGSRREDLLGRHIFDAFPDDPGNPDRHSASMLRRSLERVLESGRPDSLALIPYRVPRHGNGAELEDRYWSATHIPILDGRGQVAFILQNTVDVTELQRLQAAAQALSEMEGERVTTAGVLQRAQLVQETNRSLDSERQRLLRLFEQAPGFICFLRGPSHIVELANAAYLQLVGHREILGKPVTEALPEVREQGFTELLDRVLGSGEPYVGRGERVLLQRVPGTAPEETFVDFVYQPIVEPDGQISGVFVQGSDVTAQVRAQEELRGYREHLEELVRERSRALEESQAALRQAQKIESLGQLTGGVAHDFNNILAANITSLELALRRGAEPPVSRLLENALSAARRGAELVDRLLAFARKQRLEPRPCELSALIASMADLLRRALGQGVALELSLAENLWLVRADAGQFENAILNLAVNARDAMPGGGRLHIETCNVGTGGELPADLAAGDYVRVTVADTGTGMSPEVAAKAFDPFYTTKDVGKGTGLGLSQVYGFAKRSGGTVVIASRPGAGTRITLYLPRTRELALPEAEPAQAPPPAPRGKRLLVVDDDPAVREALAEMLREMGMQVVAAEGAFVGLALLADGAPVDAVLVDYAMPGMSGTDFIRQLHRQRPDLPCLLITGYVGDDAARASVEAAGGLRKPFAATELAAALNRLLPA